MFFLLLFNLFLLILYNNQKYIHRFFGGWSGELDNLFEPTLCPRPLKIFGFLSTSFSFALFIYSISPKGPNPAIIWLLIPELLVIAECFYEVYPRPRPLALGAFEGDIFAPLPLERGLEILPWLLPIFFLTSAVSKT